MSSQAKQKRVCIIGAGSSGIVALKECLSEGFQTTCYELDSELGGVWYKKEDGRSTSNTAMVWETLYTNTTKYLMAYSDFPPSDDDSLYFTCRAMHRYYTRYVKHFNLLPFIKFNTRVLKVRKTPDHNRTGKWEVFTCPTADFRGGDMSPGLEVTADDLAKCNMEVFDFVLVCSGFFKLPKYPENVEGLDSFQGPVQHSISYKDGRQYEDKTVLVVGNSYSAGDLANDVSNHARQVYLAVGEGTWIWPRIMSNSKGLDMNFPRSLVYSSNMEVEYNNFVIKEAQGRMDHYTSNICPATPPSKSAIMIGDDIYLRILSTRIKVYGRLQSVKGNEARFKDGAKVTGIDAIILGTGYLPDVSFIDMDIIGENGKMNLFEMMFPVSDGPHTLAFVGLFAADSNIVKVAELQSRYIAKVIADKLKLPSRRKMQESADFYNEYSLRRKGNYSYFLAAFPMADKIAQLLGVYPSFWRLFFWDPILALRTWYGPQYTAQYRLLGPDSNWDAARRTCYRAHSEGNQSLQHKPHNDVKREDLADYWMRQRKKFAIAIAALATAAYFAFTRIHIY